MTFAIRTGIALPPKTRIGGNSKYPLAQLQEGQSFFIPNAKKAVQVTLSKSSKALGIKVTTRRMQDYVEFDADGNGVGEKVDGLMVWRVAAE